MNQLQQGRQETGNSLDLKDSPTSADGTLPNGQEMAAGIQDVSHFFNVHNPEMGSWSLKAVNLGPTLNVITPEQSAPDAQSLEAFARSQGLDEKAVQWLMGKPVDTLTPSMQQLPADELGVRASSEAGLSASLIAGLNQKMGIPVALSNPVALNTPLSPPPGEPGSQAASMATLSLASSVFAKLESPWAMALSDDASPATATSTAVNDSESAEAAALQIQLMRQPTPTAVWMLRNAQPAEVKPDPATAMSTVSESELDLGEDISPELLDSLLTGSEDTHSPAPMATTAQPGAVTATRQEAPLPLAAAAQSTGAAENAGSNGAERSENIQNLAEKMGQAVGKRMLTEIEKGQWHLKLQLRPATLGHIEVEMRMLSGELDAVFNAPQALTRELLQEGMSRLKETLNQMGMDVASMQVKDGQTRQNGGKSTPNQASKSPDLVKNDSELTNSPSIARARQKMGEDGWDVLV